MIHREIDLDEESDQILSSLAQDYNGDLGKALGDLLHAHQGIEPLAEACEEGRRDELLTQKERTERDLHRGRFTPWEEVKRRHNL
jgi:hypothetical protein